MNKFDLEKAKAGAPVQTVSGHSVRILCFDAMDEIYPIIALMSDGIHEKICAYTIDGEYLVSDENANDLIMVSTKKTGWINVYMTGRKGERQSSIKVYESKEEALKYTSESCLDTIQIEWEE